MAQQTYTAVDADGNEVTLYDTDDPAEDATIAAQTSYSGVFVGPSSGETYAPSGDGILPAAVDGDLEITTDEGSDVVIPQGALSAGQILPIGVAAVDPTGSSTQTLSDIIILRE